MPKTDFIAVGSIIIDDIVYPDGRTSMGVLGGGGTHAAYGIAFTGEPTGLVGLVGDNLPADIRERLSNDFDISGLSWSPHPQLRGWQIFEWNGVRNEVFRVEVIDPFVDHPFADSADIPFKSVRGLTLLREPEFVAGWRQRFPIATLLWEPIRVFMLSAERERFVNGIRDADIVSPNLHEAQTMYGLDDELEIMRRMLADGVKVAALRMGERGSLVAKQGDSQAHFIPAVQVAGPGRPDRRGQYLLRRIPRRLCPQRRCRDSRLLRRRSGFLHAGICRLRADPRQPRHGVAAPPGRSAAWC